MAEWLARLYTNTLERERRTLYGDNAEAKLISVTPSGETVLYTLTTGAWVPRRIETIESSAPEQWRLEVMGDLVDWANLQYVTKIRMRGATDEEQVYEVLERYNAMKPAKVYHIRMQAKANIDPSV